MKKRSVPHLELAAMALALALAVSVAAALALSLSEGGREGPTVAMVKPFTARLVERAEARAARLVADRLVGVTR